MTMKENPSSLVIEQRLRNRIMEVIEILADGDGGVRRVGAHEYFNLFYDFIPHRDDGEMYPSSAISLDERELILEVRGILDDACDATPRLMGDDELIGTGWPKRIQAVARKALDLMLTKGRLSEEFEEDSPLSR